MDRAAPNDISGDVPLSPHDRFRWYMRNAAQYLSEPAELERVWNFRCSSSVDYPGPLCRPRQTPSRVLSNLFWLNLPREAIRNELGPIRLLDIGCGSGRYFKVLDRRLGGVESYIGIDASRKKMDIEGLEMDQRARFIETRAEEVAIEAIEDRNLIFSQSALEHLTSDLLCLRRIAEIARAKPEPTLHLHLLPSALMFRQYGPHGYRGYDSRAIKAIAELFEEFSEVTLYTLGGPRCVEVHCDYIFDCFDTGKRDRRKWHKARYVEALKAALAGDMAEAAIPVNEACGVALVIHTAPKTSIFGEHTFE